MRHDIGQVIQQNKDKYTPDSKHHQMLREELARANVQGTNGASVDQIQSVVSPILQRIEQLDQRITNNQAAAAAAATPEQEIDVQGNPYNWGGHERAVPEGFTLRLGEKNRFYTVYEGWRVWMNGAKAMGKSRQQPVRALRSFRYTARDDLRGDDLKKVRKDFSDWKTVFTFIEEALDAKDSDYFKWREEDPFHKTTLATIRRVLPRGNLVHVRDLLVTKINTQCRIIRSKKKKNAAAGGHEGASDDDDDDDL